jgi:hypothetical protein
MNNLIPLSPWLVVLALATWRTLATGDPYWGVVGFIASSVVGLSGVYLLFSRASTPTIVTYSTLNPEVVWVDVTPRRDFLPAYGLDDPNMN